MTFFLFFFGGKERERERRRRPLRRGDDGVLFQSDEDEDEDEAEDGTKPSLLSRVGPRACPKKYVEHSSDQQGHLV